ncbi:LOW QUALITY PROTEIN: hypothetical protein PTSG_13149 [Salpingoeca rosetta]|uniref:protein-tyrosine-phosphatase n=1 Tax=Salpingoeca rosetta (strain ATCC 50818 / BSB-021) TaxID=946362 RepID=F2USN3_SALR5|nr:LOW QUALITY PROTEIN: uncharacterized protein PTSG_13149 [Salpingoeca rosetta]EGD81142.1 LOW QUALITY PROTEIN: hypothetical protein PTSG_13149 [Salpingoeca rosetta]|eukprot:XP_004987827.1 LOW QUALITY PROTEIN: hypothetical protein PTSG_13149 [Salpingoeca rosetta]
MAQRAGSRKGRASARASGMSTKAGSRTEAPAPSATPRPWALVSALAVIALLASFTPFAIAQTRACDGEACRVNRNHTIEIYNLMANDFNQTEFEQALVAAANLTGASVVQVTVREADTVCDSGTPTGFDARTDPITRSTCSQERRRRNATMPSPPPPPSTTTMTSNTTAMPATMASNSTTVPATMPSNMTTTASNTTMPSNSTAMPATTAVNATTTTTTTTTTTMDPCTCAENQYVVEACNPTQNITNATCADCSTCDAGQFVATNCRGMTDTQCGNCTDGTFQSMTAHLEMSCKPCTDTCGSGTFLASACTRTMDTQCSACPDNTFQSADSHNLTSCTTCDTCTAGEFAFLQCTPTSNILCNNCTGFTYQDLLMHNSSTCKDCSMCGQGQFVADACTATTNTNCSACTGATFQNMTSHYEMECQACSMCGQGTFLAMACNRTSDAMCSACQNGTYQDSSSHLEEQCKQCGRCDPGQRLLSPCTATSNTSCVACDSGTWQNATGHLDPTCMMCSKCGLGQKLTTNCTLTANTVCTTCEDGTFQDTDDHTLESCTACRTCTAGEEFESSPCAASADRACDPITTCDPRYSRERYAPTPTSDRVCLDFRKAAVTVVVQVDTLETEIDATRAAIEAAIQDGSNGPLARELRKLDDAAYNNTEVTYLPQVSRFDVPSEGRQFVYLDLQFAASSTQFDIQKLDLLDVLDAFLLNATEDADATATFMERSTVSTTTTNTTTNATTTTYSTTALFRVDVDAALTITTDALNAMAAAIDAANTTSLQRTAGPTPNGEPVMFIPCEPCRSTTHPGLYQELGFCGGLCLQCTECSLDQYLTNVCEGTSDAQCNALPTEFETAPPVNVIGVNTNHILPTAASQQQDQAMDASMRVNRSFVFTNIAPGESTWVAVSGEPEDGAQMVTRPLAPAAQVDCAPVLDNVYATYPTAQVVLAALDASGHSRVARTNVTVRFVAADDEDAEVTATCTMPTDGPAVCNAWTTFADAWFSSAGPRLVDVTFKYTTPRADGEGYETSPDMACGQLTLGPTQQEVLGVSSSIAAVVTPTNSVFENDTVDVAVIARHDWAVHSFGVSLRCGNCRIEMSEANTAAWSISSTVTTDEESGEQMLVVAGIARDLTDEPKFSEQRSFSLFTATVHAVPAAEDSMLVLRGNIDSFLQATCGSRPRVSSSNLPRFTSSANAARLYVAAVVMEQVTENRQQLALAPSAVAFASDNTDVATVAQSNDDPATVTTTATSGLAAITAQWPKATCARKTFEAAVNVTTTDATVVSIAVSPTSVDLVVPFANAGAAEAVTGLPSSAAFTVTRTLSDGSVETVTSASFTSADENCGDFTGMLALETDAVASECTYTTVDGDLMASVTVNKYALDAVRMTVTARGVEGSATHTSGAAAAEQFEVPPIGAGATAWPALTASCVAVFNTTKQDMAVTVQLRQVATMAQAVFASSFTAANDDQQDQEDAALALQPADASLQITTSIAGNATLSATFGGLTATTAVLFAAGDDASLPLSVTGASVADVVANANGTFPLLGRVNATFTLDIAAEVTGEPLSPGQVRLDDGSLAIRSLVTFTSSNTDALSVDAHGIITLHDGSATEVTIGIAVNGTVQATVTCLPSLLPAEGAGSFGPHGVSAASFSRVRVPLHVEAENLRAAVLSLTYDPALLALATVELGSDVQFAFLDFNVRTPGELSVFVVIPGNAITSDDLELGVAVFTTRNLTTTSPQLSLGGSVVEVDANGNPSLVELDATTSSLFVETTPMMMTRRRRSSLTSDGAADLELDAAAMVANTLARRRRSGPRGTLTTVLANHPTFDMNGDGVLDVLDVLMLSDVYSGRLTENDLAEGADADTNSDGIVSFDDVSFLLSLAAGRLVALRRVAVTTVQAADSDCMLSFNVSVLLTNITLSTPEADDTRLYLDVAGVASSSDFDATFAAASTAPGPNFKFVRIPYARTNRTEDTGAYFLQASTPLASSDQLGVSVLQVDGSGAYNFHTRQDMIVNNTLDASFDVDGTNVSLFLPFGYAPIRAFTNTMDTPTCLAQRRPVITDFTRPDPDAMNVVDGYLLLLDWTAPPTPPNAITRYFVQYRDLNVTGAPVIEKSVDGNTLHLDLTDQILPYHTYEVQVQAEFGNRRSVISTPATAQTHQDTPNMPPQLDAIAVINATAVNVTWTPLDETDLNGVVQYLVLVQRLDDEPNADPNAPSQFVRTVDHPASSIVFTGLEESVKYNVTIQARTNVDTGFAISATEFYLPAIVFETDDAPPDLPPAVVSIVPSDTSFTITWEAPPPETHNSDLVAYLVRVRRAANTTYADNTTITDADFGGADDWHVFRYSAQTFTKDFTTLESGDPLHPAIVYEFQMQTEGSMSSLLSPWSETYTVRLLESAPTGNVTNTDVTTTSSSLMVEWQLPEPLERKGLITNFTIVYSRQDDDPRVATDSLDNCPASVCNSFVPANGDVVYTWPLVGLEAYVTYTVEVRAWTSAGIGPAATFVIRTDEAIPSAPVVFGDVSVTPRTVDIDFDPLPVPDRNGIVAYTATLTISTDPFYTQRIDSTLAASLPIVTEFENQPNSTITFQATGLQPFMEYTLEVVPHTSVGDGEANTITVLTEEETPTAPAITNVQVLADDTAQEKRVRVSVNIRPLNRRNGVLQNLTIEYGNDAFGDLATLQTPLTSAERATTTVSRVIDGLRAGVLYSFTATVTNRAPVSPESPTSPSFSKTTDEYIPTGPVLNLVAAEETDETDASKRVLLTWNPPTLATRNGIITEYRVVVRVTPNQQAQAQVHSDLTYSLAELGSNNQGDGLSTRFTSLGAYDKYTFSVTPLTAIGEGTDTTTVSTPDNNGILSPALPGASVGQLTTTKGTTTLDVSWNALAVSDWNDASLQYRVILTQLADDHSDTPAEHVVATQETSTTSVSFSGLQEYVQYKVDVYPINSVFVGMEQAGGFDASALLTTNTVRTEAAPPAATPVITDRSNDAHSITVQWGRIAMHDFNGPPRHYVVSYKGLAVDYVENGGQSATSPELDATDVIVPYDASEENPSVTLMDLEPNRMYEIKVAPENTEFAPGPFSATESVQTWSFRPAELPTVQFHDDRPNGESKQTTLRITWPIINTRFGPVRQVQVIVEPEDSRHFNTMYNCTSASGEDECAFGDWQTNENARVNKQTPRAYIAFQRQYTGDDATQTSGSLVVGDELNYGGFFNGPLRAGTTYTVRLRAFTQSGDGTEMFDTVGPIKEPVYDEKGRLISSPQASTSSPAASPIGAIVGAIIVVLIIVVLVFLFVRYRRNQKSKPPLFESSAPSNGTTNVHSSQGNPYFGNGGSNGYGQAVSSLQTSASSMPMSPMGYAQNGQHHQQQQGGLAARGNMPVQQPPGASMASTSFGGPPVPVRPPGTMAAPVVAGDSSSIYSSMGGAGAPQMPPVQRHEVSVPDLPRVIEQMSANSNFIFSEEYECVEKGDQFPRTSSQLDANRSKNRYANILAYDYTRVKLSVIGGDPNSDYINANYIDGYSVPKYYIAAQGPLPHTVIDFWRMIWENRTTVIVMVTRLEEKGRIKCHQYWPQAVGDQLPLTTNMSIWFTKQEEFPDFVIRTLTVQVGRQSRTVTQFQYVSWPDHGVPDSTAGIITMLRKAKVLRSQPNAGPMVVHCSAGVGRTGTFLALDYNLDKASRESRVDIFGCLNMMRRQRNTMVQTEDQYIFIYSSLCDALSTAVTEMSPKSLRKHFHELRRPVAGSNMSNLEQEFNRLAQGPAPAVRTDSAQILANKEKNRFNNILPFDNTRVKLQTVPGVVGSDYINASFIDGFKQKGAFIATQGPLENTLADFWRMVWEQGVHSVVMMTHLEENGRVKSEQYWPDPDEPPLNFGDYQVTLLSEVNRGFFMERTMMLVNLLLDETREVKQWQYLEWPTQGTPTAGTNLVRMIQEIEQYANSRVVMPQEESIYGNREIINEHAILQQMKPLVVHCSAGVGRTGVFVAAMICLKRMREENKMDLYQVTKHMRTQRMAMIQTPDQYAFVYRVVLDWLDMSAPVQAQPESMYSSMPAGGKAPRLSLQQEVDSQLPMRNESDSDTTRVHHGHAQPPTGAPPVRRPPPSIPPKSTSIKLKAGSNEEGGYGFDA